MSLRCKKRSGDTAAAYFHINGHPVGSQPTAEHVIRQVTQSDEGLYTCVTDTSGSSLQSFLRVRDSPPPPPHQTTDSTPPVNSPSSTAPSAPPQIFFLTAVLLPVVLVVLVLVLFLYRKQTGRKSSPPPADVTYADVTIRPTANSRGRKNDPHAVYSDGTHTSGPAEVTYGQVIIKNKKKAVSTGN
ncbi:uncharacterized protein LOC115775681 [Archocentrus centrarchus]|uniref:uncharacterized protein LOC115775681 n=1 Tax=Archocentrus centrarchus TaxID=63155 RepID=UPI0011E9EC09|nr:uncharacterized protein LOC115775681 [Archocentrus centrarchus]